MGLDMYLYAKRCFAPDSDEAQRILDAAGMTVGHLKNLAGLDPRQHETSVYLSRWRHGDSAETMRSEAIQEAAGLLHMGSDESFGGSLGWESEGITVAIPCAYWRKANAIHSWFVQNCQDGIDECQEVEVHVEQLARLRSLCLDAAAAYNSGDLVKAEEILTPVGGFFFGSTEVDEYWLQDVEHTATEIERVVNAAVQLRGVTFSYRSSW